MASKNLYMVQTLLDNDRWYNEIFTLSLSRTKAINLWDNAYGQGDYLRKKYLKIIRTVKCHLEIVEADHES